MDPYEIIERRTPGGRTARFRARIGTNDGAVAQAILGDDEYHLSDLYPMTGWALDIGAHIGTVAIALALDNPDLCVVAVEALPQNAEVVGHNITLNGLGGRVFSVAEGATGDDAGPVDVTYNSRNAEGGTVDPTYLADCRFVGNIYRLDLPSITSDVVTVPGVSLSGIIERFGIDRIALVKIDCEGCEYEFFASPDIGRVDIIRGEYHDGRSWLDLVSLLERTHVVTMWSDLGGVGLFDAVAR